MLVASIFFVREGEEEIAWNENSLTVGNTFAGLIAFMRPTAFN